MAEPLLNELLGSDATQTETEVILSKANFSVVGLIASAVNGAESIFIAMVKLAKKNKFNATAREANPDISVEISEPSQTYQTVNNVRYKVTSYTIELFKPEPVTDDDINPMDYSA
ncbi:hypothetical protein NIES4074_23940 [Cylindrospermum sp. NIES-4074]|nr:hypothetical protein NIES4074_23940 [Cylindrospermum sp. NIES-4074]